MIKLPREVKNIIGELRKAKLTGYPMGSCVMETMLNRQPLDWDIYVSGKGEQVKDALDNVEGGGRCQISNIGSGLRLDYTACGDEDDVIVDVIWGEESIEERLEKQDFTVEAMAENPMGAFIDPFGGSGDLRKKLIKAVGDGSSRFEKAPIKMMKAIRLAAENDFDISKKTYEAMVENGVYLNNCSKEERRNEFTEILNAPHGGKGLRMLAGANLMPAIIGDVALKMNRRQMSQFSDLCDNLHRTKQHLHRRLGLFYSAIDGKKGEEAMRVLGYDEELERHLLDGLYNMEKIHFIYNQIELKGLLVAFGMKRYEYMDNLAKAQRIIYGSTETKIMARREYLKNIREHNEPIFVEDLAVDRPILEEAGIPEDRVDEILLMLTDVVHRKPADNVEKTLVKFAKKFKRNKLAAKTRKVKWLR